MIRRLTVSLQIALRALGRNRMRTVLTMLGVIIGVAAVIAMVALGSGARASVERSLRSAGTNIILVSAGNFTRGGESMNIASGLGSATTLTLEDRDAIREISGVQFVAGGVRNRTWVTAPHRRFFGQVRGTAPKQENRNVRHRCRRRAASSRSDFRDFGASRSSQALPDLPPISRGWVSRNRRSSPTWWRS